MLHFDGHTTLANAQSPSYRLGMHSTSREAELVSADAVLLVLYRLLLCTWVEFIKK
ncbi:hypothetical protein M3J09_013316 [Ascochyta lentis]